MGTHRNLGPEQGMIAPQESREAETPCLVCRQAISLGAKKCPKCGSFQDWSRHIFRWSGLATAVVALLPMWGIMLSLWRIAMPGAATIAVSVLSCDRTAITAAIANTGQRTTVVEGVEFKVIRDPAVAVDVYRDERVLTPEDFKPIKAGDMLIAKYRHSDQGADLPTRKESKSCLFQLTFTATSFEAKPAQSVASCNCPDD